MSKIKVIEDFKIYHRNTEVKMFEAMSWCGFDKEIMRYIFKEYNNIKFMSHCVDFAYYDSYSLSAKAGDDNLMVYFDYTGTYGVKLTVSNSNEEIGVNEYLVESAEEILAAMNVLYESGVNVFTDLGLRMIK